jgi:glycosylphosphatidylinositol phospholipase D
MALLSWVDGPPARLELTYRVTAIDPDSGLGTAAAGPADVDGDGLGDVVLGLPGATLAQGEVLILPGPATVDIVVGPVPPYSALVVSGGPSMALGAAVGAVDIDGDGALDLAASQGTAAGATWLLYGPPGPDTEIAEIDGTATFVAQGPDAGAGASLATGDLDADGLADLAIAVEGGLANGPRVAIVPGGSDRYGGLLDLDMFDAIAAEGGIGWSAPSLATASDVDGEGTGDLIVGWPQAGPGVAGAGGGVVSLFVGPIASTDAWLGAHLSVLGRQLGDETGASVSSADLDGDATHELVYGLPGVGDGAGAVHMADGAAAGVLDLATATPLAFVVGTIGDARLGASVAGLDDLDGDGWDDVAVGSPGLAGVGLLWGGPID